MSFDSLEFWTLIWGAATALVATSAAFGSEEPENEDDEKEVEEGGELDDESGLANIYEWLANPDESPLPYEILDGAKKFELRDGCVVIDDRVLFFPNEGARYSILEDPTELFDEDDSIFAIDDEEEAAVLTLSPEANSDPPTELIYMDVEEFNSTSVGLLSRLGIAESAFKDSSLNSSTAVGDDSESNYVDEPKYLLGPNGEYRLVEGTETLERYVIDEAGHFVPQEINRQEIPFLPAKIFFRSPNRDSSNDNRPKIREESGSNVAAASESGFFGIDSAAISDSVGFDDISDISDPGASSLGGFSSLGALSDVAVAPPLPQRFVVDLGNNGRAPTNVEVPPPPPPSVGSRKEVAGASVETFWAPVETSDSPDDEEEDDDFPSETASNPFANAESSPESASNPFETSSSSVPFSSSPSEPRAPSETKYSDFLSSSVDTEPSKKVQNKSRTASTPRFSDSLSSSVDIEPPTSAKKEPQNRKSSDDSRTARAPQLPPREETGSEPDKPFEPGNPFEVDTFEDSSVSFIFHSSEVPEDE